LKEKKTFPEEMTFELNPTELAGSTHGGQQIYESCSGSGTMCRKTQEGKNQVDSESERMLE
jgi:hypothetical protein